MDESHCQAMILDLAVYCPSESEEHGCRQESCFMDESYRLTNDTNTRSFCTLKWRHGCRQESCFMDESHCQAMILDLAVYCPSESEEHGCR